MTTPEPARVTPRNVTEISILGYFAAIGIILGVIVIIVGLLNWNGGYFDGPDLSDIAAKSASISIGTALASAGFLAMLAGIVLSGVKKIVEDSAR